MNGAAAPPETDFPVARCAGCARDVLTHVQLDARDEERWLCLHCDAEIDPREVRWVREAELEPLGYGVHGEDAGGCGRSGCGKGNCSNRP